MYQNFFYLKMFIMYGNAILLKNLYRDPLALSRFSQFRCLHISKGEIIQNLNETHEFQVCFVLKGSLCLFRDHIESMPLMAMQNEFSSSAACINVKSRQWMKYNLSFMHVILWLLIYIAEQ